MSEDSEALAEPSALLSVSARLTDPRCECSITLFEDYLAVFSKGKVDDKVRIEDIDAVGIKVELSSTVILPLPVKIPSGSKISLSLSAKGGLWEFMHATVYRQKSQGRDDLSAIYQYVAAKTRSRRVNDLATQLGEDGFFKYCDVTFHLNPMRMEQQAKRIDLGGQYFVNANRGWITFGNKRFFGTSIGMPQHGPNADIVSDVLEKVYGMKGGLFNP